MKRSIEDHAARFDEKAAGYDDGGTEAYRTALSLVVEYADPGPGDVVLDIGTGTGAVALALADRANSVLGRDVSEGMLEEARAKAHDRGLENVSFAEGRFREPNLSGEPVDVVTSNFAMHHIDDSAKREAVGTLAGLGPRRVVLGDLMLFGGPDPEAPFYSPEVDDPATVGVLADAVTDAGFVLTAVEMVDEHVGVLVADREGVRERKQERRRDREQPRERNSERTQPGALE
jgi:SAM-dependent methyltransferase